MYGRHNLWDLLKYSFCTILLLLVLSPSHSTTDPGFRWRFYMTETWDQGIRSHLISTTDCQPLGLPSISPSHISNHPTCHNYWGETYGGCSYCYCNIHHLGHFCQDPFTGTFYILTISDPWDSRWATGGNRKIIPLAFSFYPTASLPIYRTYAQVSLPQIQSAISNQAHTIHEQEQLLQTHLQANPAQDQGPFSWIKLIQQGTSLASLSSMGNLSHCFICATLGKDPLVAVPLPHAFNCTNPTPTPWDILPLSMTFPYSLTLSTTNSLSVIPPLTLPSATSPCQMLPPIMPHWVSLASTLVATGLGTGTLIHSVDSTRELSERLQVAIEASAESPAYLQRQMTSVARMALQNLCAWDPLTTDMGGACMFLNEGCCYYINEQSLQSWYHPGGPTPQWSQTPLTTRLLPLPSPLLIIGILLTVAPCISVNQLILHPYSCLSTSEGPHDAPYSAGSSQI
ncbi:unnamed protein product [Nyctereutes procyonoides]|uniref:(raccoon dog) hypothetical protein n=1 Tax=Nyctereutes procyonoides TaxID=34880 RepID=A0A811Y2M0_NYCPR|nr:unnamed protein product [Nyctereutes procyonoides]